MDIYSGIPHIDSLYTRTYYVYQNVGKPKYDMVYIYNLFTNQPTNQPTKKNIYL